MKVRIEFNDKNRALAAAIGAGLMSYGLSKGLAAAKLEKVTTETASPDSPATGIVGHDLATLEDWIAKYGEPVDPSDWAKVPDRLIPAKEVFPGVDEDAVAAAIGKAGQAETITPDDTGPELIPAGPVELDEHGVPFDAEFCGRSESPFYATGPRTGQWKKKRGVDVDEYDIWYDENRPTAEDPEPAKVDTAAAFAAEPTPAKTDLPATPGDLMKWCAEQTAAGAMTTADVTAAYATCGITVADMFGPEGPAHVKAILAVLVK